MSSSLVAPLAAPPVHNLPADHPLLQAKPLWLHLPDYYALCRSMVGNGAFATPKAPLTVDLGTMPGQAPLQLTLMDQPVHMPAAQWQARLEEVSAAARASGGEAAVISAVLAEIKGKGRAFMVRSKADPFLKGSLTFINGHVYLSVNSARHSQGSRYLLEPLSHHSPALKQQLSPEKMPYVWYCADDYPSVRPSEGPVR